MKECNERYYLIYTANSDQISNKKEGYMKTKKIGRKLALNKKTIAGLNTEKLSKVIGAKDITKSGPGEPCCQPDTHGGYTGCTVCICS